MALIQATAPTLEEKKKKGSRNRTDKIATNRRKKIKKKTR
jgi:hypothetical protein